STSILSASTLTAPAFLYTLSLHDALPICPADHVRGTARAARHAGAGLDGPADPLDRLHRPRRHRHGRSGRPADRLGRLRLRDPRSEEHTSELQSRFDIVCRLLLEKKNNY